MIIQRMSNDLGLSTAFILSLSRTASHQYKEFQIPKRTQGVRLIHHPSKRLKALQRWLLTNVVEPLPVHEAAKAYRRHHSIFQNASVHASQRYLLRMDLTNFFPSITQADVAKYIADRPAWFSDWTSEDAEVFCKLVCRRSVLTIGAPTSSGLSNAICYDMDAQIDTLCRKNHVTYTRYADDLFFSTDASGILGQIIEGEVAQLIHGLNVPAGLKINPSKTRHSSKQGTRRVTGIVLGSDGRPYIGRALKRRIRALIHKFDTLDEARRASLAGLIIYARGFDPQFANSLINKYGPHRIRKATTPPTKSA